MSKLIQKVWFEDLTIYLDIIFIENILMNYIILFATLVIIKPKTIHQQIRLIVSSIIGSIYAIIVYLNILTIYSNIFTKIILSIVMVYVAYGAKNFKQLLRQLLVFYLVSFIFGGCTFALIYFIKPENVKIHNGVFVGTYPIKVALIAGAVAFIITQIVFKINKSRLDSKNQFIDIEIFFKENVLKVKALLDSGNMLSDPISGAPVIIVEKQKLDKIIPEEFLDYIENIVGGGSKEFYDRKIEDREYGNTEERNNENKKLQEYLSKVRMVPFMSIGKENGMLVGIRMDKIKIKAEDTDIERKNIIVGIYNKKLTKDNKYNALIGLNLLEGEEKDELITNAKK